MLSNRNLPATPKSITDPNVTVEIFSSAIRSENETAMDDNEPTGDAEKTEYEYEEENDDSTSDDNHQRFILAPTPAQLGRAPLQRRLQIVGGDANSMFISSLYSIGLLNGDHIEDFVSNFSFRSIANS